MDYFGRVVAGEDYLADDWDWRQKLWKQRQTILEETSIPRKTRSYGVESTTLEPLDLAYRTPLPLPTVTPAPAFCGNCCRKMPTYGSGLSNMADDITYRALPDLSDVTHYPGPAYSGYQPGSRFDYLTSRRYPYNKTMTELIDDIRHEQNVDKIMTETARNSSSNYWSDRPRVVETSYYDVTPTSSMTKANSMENLYVPQEKLRKWEAPESFYEKGPAWHAAKRNEDFPLRGTYHTSYTPYVPYKHVHNEYPTYRRECRPMSRYVYEVQPYHTVRELEMDRIMKAKFQKKFFAKREKKPEDIPAKRIVETGPAELTVPETEPFRRAFAVNGFKSEEVDSAPKVEKPTRYFEVAKPSPGNEVESPDVLGVEEKVNKEVEPEVEPENEPEVEQEIEDLAEVVIIPEKASELREVIEVIPEPVHVSKTYDTKPETEDIQEPEIVTETVPEPVAEESELVPENKEEEQVTETDSIEPEKSVEEHEAVPEIIIEPEAVPEVVIEPEIIPNNVNESETAPETEQVPEEAQLEVNEEPQTVPEVDEVESEIVHETQDISAEDPVSSEDSVPENVDSNLVTKNIEEVPETAESVVEDKAAPESFEEETKMVDEAESCYTENQVSDDDGNQVSSVKEILDDVMDVASAVTALDSNANVQDMDEAPVQEQEEADVLDGTEDEILMTAETVKTFKTGQIMIEETDLGDDECIRTEYEIEEVEISQ